MNIACWNVNGLRALHKKGQFEWLVNQNFDIFCLQETKSHPDQLAPEIKEVPGYEAYFDHSKLKKGYSGVAIYTKIKPEKVEYGLGVPRFDEEGRLLVMYFKNFVLLTGYFPNGGGGPQRLAYKLDFYKHFLDFVNKLVKKGHNVVFCGDINTAHTEIDLARPKANEENTGFLPIERAWIDDVVKAGFVDAFRYKNPDKKDSYTYWDMKTFARERNVGWRIDYFFVNKNLKDKIVNITHLDHVFGSDHCPLVLTINL